MRKLLSILIPVLSLGGPMLSAGCSPDTAPVPFYMKYSGPDSKKVQVCFPPVFDRARGVSWDGRIAWKTEERVWVFAAALEGSLKGINCSREQPVPSVCRCGPVGEADRDLCRRVQHPGSDRGEPGACPGGGGRSPQPFGRGGLPDPGRRNCRDRVFQRNRPQRRLPRGERHLAKRIQPG